MCSKCKTIAIGNDATKCPNCGEPFSDYQTMKVDLKLRELELKKQDSGESFKEIEKRLEFTASEMGKIQKKIDNIDNILENQKNLKSRHDILERELNRLKHTALP